MKIFISESQYKRLIETEEEQEVLEIPNLRIFGKDGDVAWNRLQKFLEKKGNPPYSIGGDLDLRRTPIKSLENLQSVGGYLDLRDTPIESLGNLQSVGRNLDLEKTPIQSLGNLEFVGGDLYLRGTPVSKMYSKEEIREMLNVEGGIL